MYVGIYLKYIKFEYRKKDRNHDTGNCSQNIS